MLCKIYHFNILDMMYNYSDFPMEPVAKRIDEVQKVLHKTYDERTISDYKELIAKVCNNSPEYSYSSWTVFGKSDCVAKILHKIHMHRIKQLKVQLFAISKAKYLL